MLDEFINSLLIHVDAMVIMIQITPQIKSLFQKNTILSSKHNLTDLQLKCFKL